MSRYTVVWRPLVCVPGKVAVVVLAMMLMMLIKKKKKLKDKKL